MARLLREVVVTWGIELKRTRSSRLAPLLIFPTLWSEDLTRVSSWSPWRRGTLKWRVLLSTRRSIPRVGEPWLTNTGQGLFISQILLTSLVSVTMASSLASLSLVRVLHVKVSRFPLLLTITSRGRLLGPLVSTSEQCSPIVLPTAVQLPVFIMAPIPKSWQLPPEGIVPWKIM